MIPVDRVPGQQTEWLRLVSEVIEELEAAVQEFLAALAREILAEESRERRRRRCLALFVVSLVVGTLSVVAVLDEDAARARGAVLREVLVGVLDSALLVSHGVGVGWASTMMHIYLKVINFLATFWPNFGQTFTAFCYVLTDLAGSFVKFVKLAQLS